jgi:hypothetical protein
MGESVFVVPEELRLLAARTADAGAALEKCTDRSEVGDLLSGSCTAVACEEVWAAVVASTSQLAARLRDVAMRADAAANSYSEVDRASADALRDLRGRV